MAAVNAVPGLSLVKSMSSAHLTEADAYWSHTADQLEQSFATVSAGLAQPGGAEWKGVAATSAQETYTRAVEPEPSVTVTEETFFGHGWQPLTITVLQAIWFMAQGAEFGVEELVDWFRGLGWKSANGKPLGHDAVRRELSLIRKAGYINAQRLRDEKGRAAGIQYEVSKRARGPASSRSRLRPITAVTDLCRPS